MYYLIFGLVINFVAMTYSILSACGNNKRALLHLYFQFHVYFYIIKTYELSLAVAHGWQLGFAETFRNKSFYSYIYFISICVRPTHQFLYSSCKPLRRGSQFHCWNILSSAIFLVIFCHHWCFCVCVCVWTTPRLFNIHVLKCTIILILYTYRGLFLSHRKLLLLR